MWFEKNKPISRLMMMKVRAGGTATKGSLSVFSGQEEALVLVASMLRGSCLYPLGPATQAGAGESTILPSYLIKALTKRRHGLSSCVFWHNTANLGEKPEALMGE
jgi:hypothetical protein